MNSPVKVTLDFPQVPRGSASKYAWGCQAAVIRLTAAGQTGTVARSGRLLSWKSGNFSSRAKVVVAEFEAKVSKLQSYFAQLPPASALIEAKRLVVGWGSPGFRRFERAVDSNLW